MAITGVNVTYGDYQFKPAPNISYERESFSIKNTGKTIGGNYRLTLDGTLLPTGNQSALDVFQAKEELYSGVKDDYKVFIAEFLGTADCTGYVVRGRPLIDSISISSDDNGGYIQKAQYSIGLTFPVTSLTGTEDHLGTGLLLEDLSTSYAFSYLKKPYKYYGVEFPAVVEIQRSMSAVGQTIGSGFITDLSETGTTTALQNAVNYLTGVATNQISFDYNHMLDLGSGDAFKSYLTERTVSQDEVAGSVTVDDTFIAIATGIPNDTSSPSPPLAAVGAVVGEGSYTEASGYVPVATGCAYMPKGEFCAVDTFNVNVEKSNEDGLTVVSIDGTVQGYPSLDVVSGSFRVTGTGGFDMARFYVTHCLDSGVFANRAGMAYSGQDTFTSGQPTKHLSGVLDLDINRKPLSETYGYNIEEGTITYGLQFNNRPSTCATGVLSEIISVTRQRPTDVYASHVILGRNSGPLLQDIGTKTAFTQDMSIEATVVPNTGCNEVEFVSGGPLSQYDEIVDNLELGLSGEYGSIFRTADSESYDVKTGRYNRSVSWIYTECS